MGMPQRKEMGAIAMDSSTENKKAKKAFLFLKEKDYKIIRKILSVGGDKSFHPAVELNNLREVVVNHAVPMKTGGALGDDNGQVCLDALFLGPGMEEIAFHQKILRGAAVVELLNLRLAP